jgi:hypothetical protein
MFIIHLLRRIPYINETTGGIFKVNFNVIDQMFYIYEIPEENRRTVYRLHKDYDLVRKEALYNILIESHTYIHSYIHVVRLVKLPSSVLLTVYAAFIDGALTYLGILIIL